MRPLISFHRHVASKYYLLISIFSLFMLMQHPLEAGGFGSTKESFQYEDTTWDGVFFDMNGLNFNAYIPNYAGTMMQNGGVTLRGAVEEAGYIIITSMNPGFTPPKSIDEFVKMVQDANPGDHVVKVNAKKFGTKYAVDVIPNNQEDPSYWRLFTTNDRLIKMGSNDSNANRRLKFFDSLKVK